jgi:hypothetical protein
VEQRIGPIIPPLHTAGTDPGHIPGLTPSRPDGADEEVVEQPVEDAVPSVAPEGAVPAEETEPKEVVAESTDDAEEGAEAKGAGPLFEISDRRSSITAGSNGVTFKLDGETAEFRWDEIGAVEMDTPRFGRRFGVTVYTTAHRWYTADVEASARSLLKEWTAELDAVLDAYFEDVPSA